MYSLLIAEDEAWMRELLLHTVAWESVGITRLYEAGNGADALSIVRNEAVDFVLSDIRMPGLNGLELLQEVRQSGADAEFVMLSGFDDFDYVRTAMRLGAHDYLLKPVQDEELLHLFRKLTHKRNEQRSDQVRLSMEHYAIRQSRDILREKLLGDWFTGKLKDPDYVALKCEELDIRWNALAYVVFLVELDHRYVLARTYSERDLELLQYAVRNIAEELLNERHWHHHVGYVEDKLAVWCEVAGETPEVQLRKLSEELPSEQIQSEQLQERRQMNYGQQQQHDEQNRQQQQYDQRRQHDALPLGSVLKTFRNKVKEYLKITVSIGISRVHETVSAAPAAYMEAVHSLKMKLYLGTDYTFFFDEIRVQEDRVIFHQQLRERFMHSLSAGNEPETTHLLNQLFHEIQSKQIASDQVRHVIMNLLQVVWECKGMPGDGWQEKQQEQLLRLETLAELHGGLAEMFAKALADIAEQRASKKNKLMTDILNYIEQNFNQDITLHAVAERFYLNPSYLSRLFKEGAGKIFTKHIMDLRLDKAKELLAGTHMKVYEISAAVGYEDVKYFNKVFKFSVGITPADYRNNSG